MKPEETGTEPPIWSSVVGSWNDNVPSVRPIARSEPSKLYTAISGSAPTIVSSSPRPTAPVNDRITRAAADATRDDELFPVRPERGHEPRTAPVDRGR